MEEFKDIVVPNDEQPKLHGFDAVVSNRAMGKFSLIPEKLSLFIADRQRIGGLVGRVLLSILPEKIVLFNSAFLDWLLENPMYIPESFKGKFTFFAGTVFMKNGVEVIRYMYFGLNGWASSYHWLDRGFHLNSPIGHLTAA